jgi:OOP family OmpA-OmpF porin
MGHIGILLAAFAAAWTFANGAFGQKIEERFVKALQVDAPGAADHPLIGRYAGSVLLAQTRKAFDELSLPAEPAQGKSYSEPRWGQTLKGEGKVTRSLYIVQGDRSALEVLRNYQDKLAGAGYETVFSCSGEGCGEAFPKLKYGSPEQVVLDKAYDRNRTDLARAAFDYIRDLRFVLMRNRGGEGETLVGVRPR